MVLIVEADHGLGQPGAGFWMDSPADWLTRSQVSCTASSASLSDPSMRVGDRTQVRALPFELLNELGVPGRVDRHCQLFLNASRRIICHSVGAPSEVVTSIVFLTNLESLACSSRQAARSSLLVKTPSKGPSLTR